MATGDVATITANPLTEQDLERRSTRLQLFVLRQLVLRLYADVHGDAARGIVRSNLCTTERSDTKKQANLHRANDTLPRMYTYGERLRWAMAQTDPPTSGRALALRVGVRPQSIHHLLDPARNAKGSRHTAAIAMALGVSADWLSTGTGRPYKGDAPVIDQREAVARCLNAARTLVLELERLQRALDGKG